jgi:CheY-like chemotaxis protein
MPEARGVLARGRVDAAIVDGLPPGMMGTDFIQELRQADPHLPILFASAFWKDLESHELLTRQLEVARVLRKPYTPEELCTWVEQVVKPRPPPPPPQPTQGVGPEPDDDLAAALAALNAEYGASLGEKVRQLREALERARTGEAEALEEAYTIAHKLHGTAGTYGFRPVSTAAGRLEALLRQARSQGGATDWNALRATLHELSQEASRAVSPDTPAASTEGMTKYLGTVLVADDDAAA